MLKSFLTLVLIMFLIVLGFNIPGFPRFIAGGVLGLGLYAAYFIGKTEGRSQ